MVFASNQTQLPIDFFPMGPIITVEVQNKKIQVLLDTGAAKKGIVLTPDGAQNLVIPSNSKKECSKTVYGEHCIKSFILPELGLGTYKVKEVKAGIIHSMWGDDRNEIFQKYKVKGVIGLEVLSKFNLLLDYRKHQLTLVHYGFPKGFKKDAWLRIPFRLNGEIHTKTLIHGVVYDLIWDTGSVPSTLVNNKHLKSHGHSITNIKNGEKNSPQMYSSVLTVSPEVAKVRLPDVDFALLDLPKNVFPFDGDFGSNFFEENTIFFDFEHHTIYIKQ